MKEKLTGAIQMIFKKILYGGHVSFEGIPEFDITSAMKVKGNSKISIGKHFKIRSNSYIAAVNGSEFNIGDHVFINRNCNMICQDYISIGNHCSFGPNVIIYDHDHCFGYDGIMEGYKKEPVIIEANCWIGAGSIILRGTHIGEGSVIGAGSIVQGNIPKHSLVVAKTSRKMDIIPIDKREKREKTL